MSRTRVRIDAVPESAQAIVAAAAADLVERRGLDAAIVAVTRLEPIERLETENETPVYAGFGQAGAPDHRIFFLAKGVQYVYETRRRGSPRLTEERLVV